MGRRTVLDSLNDLFKRPKACEIEYEGQKETIYIRSLTENERQKYLEIIGDKSDPIALKNGLDYIYLTVMCNKDGSPALSSKEELNDLTLIGMSVLTPVLIKVAFNIDLPEEELKNLQGSLLSEQPLI